MSHSCFIKERVMCEGFSGRETCEKQELVWAALWEPTRLLHLLSLSCRLGLQEGWIASGHGTPVPNIRLKKIPPVQQTEDESVLTKGCCLHWPQFVFRVPGLGEEGGHPRTSQAMCRVP